MSILNIAEALNILCPERLKAELLSCLLSCDQDERLTDNQAIAGETLFDALCDVVDPSVIDLAHTV